MRHGQLWSGYMAASVRVACGGFFFIGHLMPDDNKHTERVTVWFTEREFLDLMRQSERSDRKAGEMVRFIVRRFMYGNVGSDGAEINVAKSANLRD